MVVATSAGRLTDALIILMARFLQCWEEQGVVGGNRSGTGGTIDIKFTARGPADGSTMLPVHRA